MLNPPGRRLRQPHAARSRNGERTVQAAVAVVSQTIGLRPAWLGQVLHWSRRIRPYAGGTANSQRVPSARLKLASSVANLAPRVSASATYHAS